MSKDSGPDDSLRALQTALSAVRDAAAIFRIDKDRSRYASSVLWINEAFSRLTGYASEQVTGHPPCFLEEPHVSHDTAKRILTSLQGGQTYHHAIDLRSREGDWLSCELHITSVAEQAGSCAYFVAILRDTDVQRRQIEADRAINGQFQQMVDALPHIAWIANPAGNMLVCNRRWYDYTGLSENVLLDVEEGKSVIHPDDHPTINQYLSDLERRTEPFEMEYRLRRHDGVYRWHLERSVPILSENGTVVQWVGTMTDIQDRKEQEEALRRSEERYALAVNGTQDGIWDSDLETDFIYLSPRWKEMLGYITPGEQDQIPPHRTAFFSLLHPDDRLPVEQLIQDHIAGKTETYRAQFRMRHKDGSYRWIEARGRALRRPDGTAYRFAGAHADITEKKLAEAELERTRHFIDRMAVTTPDVFYILDIPAGRFAFVNRQIGELLGYPPEERFESPDRIISLLHPDDYPGFLIYTPARLRLQDGEFAEVEYRVRDYQGIWRWIFSRETPFARDEAGNVTQIFGVAQDVTARLEAEEARRLSEERLLYALEVAQEGIWDWDLIRDTIQVTPSWLEILGQPTTDSMVAGDFFRSILHPEDLLIIEELARRFAEGQSFFSVELRFRHAEGHYIWLLSRGRVVERTHEGKPTRLIGSNLDITGRKRIEESLRWRAQHDGLTDLPNRDCIREKIASDIHIHRRTSGTNTVTGALILLDLDGFKYVNDSLGHDMGDHVLIQTAQRLRDIFLPYIHAAGVEGCLARIGGDEFAIWLRQNSGETASNALLHDLARVLLDALAVPLTIPLPSGAVREILLTGSMGIALFPHDGSDMETLFKNADTAMYLAKESGRGRYRFHTAERSQAVSDRFHLETRLRSAINHQSLRLVYQPQVDVATGQIVSVEALMRWIDQELGAVFPSLFIPVAEETGMIHLLGEWTLQTACEQLRRWHQIDPRLRVCVNLSALQVVEPGIEEMIVRNLRAQDLPGTSLELELTESALLRSGEHSTNLFLAEMRKQGVRLALDDFGTGYSSLSYLRSLPVDVVKIDRAFLSDLPSNPQTRAIVKAIIDLAHALGLSVTAEGVETREQQRILEELQCDCLQGYLLSRPVPPEELTLMLQNQATLLPRQRALSR